MREVKKMVRQIFAIFLIALYLCGYAEVCAHHCSHMECECFHCKHCYHFHCDDGCCKASYSPAADQDCGDGSVTLPEQAQQFVAVACADIPSSAIQSDVINFRIKAPPLAEAGNPISCVRRL